MAKVKVFYTPEVIKLLKKLTQQVFEDEMTSEILDDKLLSHI